MRKKTYFVAATALASVALIIAGCETMGQSAGLGGLIGAGTGAAIGSHSGHAWEGALIGGAVGALAGIIIHDIKAHQTKTAQQTVQEYKYTPDQGVKIVGESGGATPTVIKPGGSVTTSVQYAVMGAGANGITIKETRTLRQNGKIIKEVSSQDFMRTDGTWESTQEIKFPANVPAGSYEVAQSVSGPNNAQFQQNVAFNIAQ